MTLIVGIRCSDGVVVAGDGAATFAVLGNQTIRQEISKLEIIDTNVVIGVSGPVGLGQRLKGELRAVVTANRNTRRGRPHETMQILRNAFFKHVKEEMEAAAIARNVIGQVANASALSSTLVALPVSGTPTLIQFDQQCAPEEASHELPFVAIGSGQFTADPFLAFLRRIFWPRNPPTVEEGVLAAVWTLQHAIQTMPGGVSEPIQVVVLKEANGEGPIARQLTDDELAEHRQLIGDAEASLRSFRQNMGTAASAETVPMPPPSH